MNEFQIIKKYFNEGENLTFPKHRFKKFIKDVVNGTIERDDLITEELETHFKEDLIIFAIILFGFLKFGK